MPEYPVMFTVRDVVSGNGFLAGVTLSGRALMVREDDGKWWVYGVRPSAIAEAAEAPGEAFANFRAAYKNYLFDTAAEARSYEDFKHEVERFYDEPDDEEDARWMTAFQAIRSGAVIPEAPFFSQLPKVNPETRPTSISVGRLDKPCTRYNATDNVPDYSALAAAA